MKNLSLSKKALLAFAILLLPVLIIFIYTYSLNRAFIKTRALDQMTVIAEAYEGQVYQFLEMSRRRAEDFASDGYIRRRLKEAVKGDAGAARRLGSHLVRNKMVLDRTIDDIHVMTLDGRIVASTYGEPPGLDLSGEPLFIEGRKGTVVTETGAMHPAAPELAISTPVTDIETGEPLGVLVNFILTSELNKLMTGEFNRELGAISWRKGRHKTMESYLVGGDGVMLTESIFVKDAAMKQRVDTEPVRLCAASSEEVSAYYANYLGEMVAGASMCIPSMGWTLIVEMSEAEVITPLNVMLKGAIAAGVTVLGIIAALYIIFARAVVRPLGRLFESAGRLSEGEYGITVPVESSDEIGALGTSFNTMAAEIARRDTELKAERDRAENYLEVAGVIMLVIGADETVKLINRRGSEILGLEERQIIGGNWFDSFIPEDSREEARGVFRGLMAGGGEVAEYHESPVCASDGRERLIAWFNKRLTNRDGAVYATLSSGEDITERKKAERRLFATNRMLVLLSSCNQALVHATDEPTFLKEICRIIVDKGGYLLAWVGLAEDDERKSVIPAAYHGRDDGYLDGAEISWAENERGMGPTGTAIRTGRPVVNRDTESNPEYMPWKEEASKRGFRSSVALPLVANQLCLGALNIYSAEPDAFDEAEIRMITELCYDIAFGIGAQRARLEHAKAEAALLESEARYRLLNSSAFDAILLADTNGTIVECNPSAEEVFGYSTGELIGKKIGTIVPDHLRERHEAGIKRFLETGKSRILNRVVEFDALHKDGSTFPVEIVIGHFSTRGKTFFTGTVRDITERKRALEELKRSEQRYRALFEESLDAIFETAIDGSILDVNPAGVRLFEYASKEELLDANIKTQVFARPEDRDRCTEEILAHGFMKDFEVQMLTRSGKELTVNLSATAVRDVDGRTVAFRGIMRDVTEHRRLEQQLLQAQKMEAIGQLTGGIAHDFNNILTAIIGYGTVMLMKMPHDDALKVYVEQILSSSNKAANLTSGLLAFSRRQMMDLRPVNLHDIIRSIEKLLSRLIGEEIDFRVSYAEQDPVVIADAGCIEQVLMNLATNARDAMAHGGTLSVTTGVSTIDADFIRAHGYGSPGRYAVIKVADTGSGMDETTRRRIFEPFFTTKEVGKGTGLGLSIVYGIVKQHNGYINVYSEPGHGTTFSIYIPATDTAAERKEGAAAPMPRGGTETVLVAEDDADIRKLTCTVLEEFGYAVIAAKDGDEAVEKALASKEGIRLMVLDVIMPGKNGKEVYDTVSRARPGVKVIFTSGYTKDIIDKKGISQEGLNFVSKPVSPTELLAKVREVLDG